MWSFETAGNLLLKTWQDVMFFVKYKGEKSKIYDIKFTSIFQKKNMFMIQNFLIFRINLWVRQAGNRTNTIQNSLGSQTYNLNVG